MPRRTAAPRSTTHVSAILSGPARSTYLAYPRRRRPSRSTPLRISGQHAPRRSCRLTRSSRSHPDRLVRPALDSKSDTPTPRDPYLAQRLASAPPAGTLPADRPHYPCHTVAPRTDRSSRIPSYQHDYPTRHRARRLDQTDIPRRDHPCHAKRQAESCPHSPTRTTSPGIPRHADTDDYARPTRTAHAARLPISTQPAPDQLAPFRLAPPSLAGSCPRLRLAKPLRVVPYRAHRLAIPYRA
jgi:hypothetical protein